MQLLDFAPEIFDTIIHELVEDVGVWGAQKFRQVCRTFDTAIAYEIFAKQPLTAFEYDCDLPPDERADKEGVLCSKAELYIYYRTKFPLDTHPGLLSPFNKVVDFLLDCQRLSDPESQDQYLKEIINLALNKTNFGRRGGWLHGILKYGEDRRKRYSSSIEEDILAVASWYGNTEIIRELFNQCPVKFSKPSNWFGNPLVYAVRQKNHLHVEMIMERLDKDLLLYDDYRLLHLSNRRRKYTMLTEAIPIAISNGIHDIAALLIKRNQQDFPRVPKREYTYWLNCAIDSGNADMVTTILKVKTTSDPKVSRSAFEIACSKGTGQIVKALLGRGKLHLNKVFTLECPLTLAIASGKVDSVEAVLDAGACADGPDPHPSTCQRRVWRTPLCRAIEAGSKKMVEALVSHGADPEQPSRISWEEKDIFTPLSIALKKDAIDIYEVLRQASMAKNGSNIPSFEEAKKLQKDVEMASESTKMSVGDLQLWTPILLR